MYFFQLGCSCLAACTVIAATAPQGTTTVAPQVRAAPRALAARLSHDFGAVDQGSTLNHQFQIRNGGATPLAITGVTLSVAGMTAKVKPEIAPGAEETLTVEWNTAGVKGAVEGTAVVEVNDPETPRLTFTMSAVVKPPIEFVPYPAVFASVYQGESARRTVRILNNRGAPLRITRLERQGEHFEAAIDAVQEGAAYELVVSVPSTVATGRYSEAVFLYTDNPKLPRMMVPVNVLVKPELYANPETVDFGQVDRAGLLRNPSMNELLTQTIMVRKRNGGFVIVNATSDLPFVSIHRTPDGGASSDAFRIEVGLVTDRLMTGSIDGSIRLVTDDPRFPEVIIPVRGQIR